MAHPQVVSILNRKGGVGKTTAAAAIAATAADWGWRVLLVELDDQGTLGLDVGYLQGGGTDRGERLLAGLTGRRLEPIGGVKPNLDFIAAGRAVATVEPIVAQSEGVLREALSPHVGSYDLIVVDCPPRGTLLTEALLASRWLLIPAKPEEGSIHGLEPLAELFGQVRAGGNPDIEPVGVLLMDVKRQATRQLARIRSALSDLLGDAVPVLEPTIRHAPTTADRLRRAGVTVPEAVAQRQSQIANRSWSKPKTWGDTWPDNVEDLAEDWARVTRVVTELVTTSIEQGATSHG